MYSISPEDLKKLDTTFILLSMKRRGISFCVWKNLHERNEMLEGMTDVDIYLPLESRYEFNALCSELGGVEVRSATISFSGISHYLFPGGNGYPIHLHVYHLLFTGESHLKDYLLPLGGKILANKVVDNELGFVVAPSDENLLIILRFYLKRSGILGAFLYLREYSDYKVQENRLKLEHGITSLPLLFQDYEIQKLAKLISKGNFWRHFFIGKTIRYRLTGFRKYSNAKALWISYTNLLKLVGNKVFFKEKKSMVDIGRFVVITGPDGAGKSTLINEVGARFSKHFTVKFLHFGQPAPSVLTLLVHVMLWFRRAIYSFRPNKTTDFSGASKKKNVSLIFALRYLALAYDRNRVGRKALAYVNRGFLVIADRYPSNNLGEMDSPKLDPELAGNWWFRQMAYMENRLYHSILESDLLIRVKVSRQTAMARNAARVKNHKETDQEIVERHTAFNKLSFNAKKQLIFENEGSLETAANTLFFAIWAEL